MAAGGTKARERKGAAGTAAAPAPLPDGMPPEILAALEGLLAQGLSQKIEQIAECAGEADEAGGTAPPLAIALASPGGFRPGEAVEVPGEGELRAALATLDDAIALVMQLFGALSACSDRVRVLDERLARIRHVTFGYKSERLSRLGLYDAVGDGADANGANGADANGAAGCTSGGGEVADGATADGGAGDGDAAGAEDAAEATAEAAGDANGDDAGDDEEECAWPPKKKKKGKARRAKGCAKHVTENCLELTQHKKVDEAVLEALRERGLTLVRLDDGCYEEVHLVNVAILLRTTYEIWEARETGERIAADRAADSKPMENSPLGADAIAGLLYSRYALSMPAPRVAREAVAAGLGITKQTIYRVSTQFAISLARLVVLRFMWHILRSHCVQSDETWLRVREELIRDGRLNSVMWLVCTSELDTEAKRAAVLTHTSTRSAEALAAMLKGFEGTLMADGYGGYPRAIRLVYEALLEEEPDTEARRIILAGCLQHCRSKYFDVVQALMGCAEWAGLTPRQMRSIPAVSMLEAIGRVFEAERGMDRDAPREVRAEYRRRRVRPLLKKVLLKCHRYLGDKKLKLDGYLRGALEYTWEQATRLFAAVDDPDVPLHYPQSGVIRRNAAPRSYRRAGPHAIVDNVKPRFVGTRYPVPTASDVGGT